MFIFYVYSLSCFSRFSERGEGRLAPGKTKYQCTTYGEDGLHLVGVDIPVKNACRQAFRHTFPPFLLIPGGRLAPGRSGAQARHDKYLCNQKSSRLQRFFKLVVHDVSLSWLCMMFFSWVCMFLFYVYCFSCFSRFSEWGEGRLAPGKTKYKRTTYGEGGLHLVGVALNCQS